MNEAEHIERKKKLYPNNPEMWGEKPAEVEEETEDDQVSDEPEGEAE